MPVEERAKGVGGDLKLTLAALDIIQAQPRFASSPYVFAGRSAGPINGFTKDKARFDEAGGVQVGFARPQADRPQPHVEGWRNSEHAERIMGHVIPGVEGIYDRHAYFDEKAIGLAKLAALIERIVHPPEGDVVVPLRPVAVQP